ncbi:MAG: hypothetical protein ACRDZ1_10260 [Acidimicrobiia bacterium]
MTRIGKTAIVAAAGAALVLGSTTWAGAGQGEDEGVPATLGVLDYEPGLLTGADIDAIPGFAVDASYGGQIEPYFGGEDLNMFCRGGSANYVEGTEIDLVGASGGAVSVIHEVGAIGDAKGFVADARDVAKGCTSPFPAGSLTLVPAAQQPKLKKAGDGVTVLATTVQSSGNAVFQIYVREGKYFISYISIVAAPQVTTLDTADLNAVTKAAAKHLATVAKEYRKKT